MTPNKNSPWLSSLMFHPSIPIPTNIEYPHIFNSLFPITQYDKHDKKITPITSTTQRLIAYSEIATICLQASLGSIVMPLYHTINNADQISSLIQDKKTNFTAVLMLILMQLQKNNSYIKLLTKLQVLGNDLFWIHDQDSITNVPDKKAIGVIQKCEGNGVQAIIKTTSFDSVGTIMWSNQIGKCTTHRYNTTIDQSPYILDDAFLNTSLKHPYILSHWASYIFDFSNQIKNNMIFPQITTQEPRTMIINVMENYHNKGSIAYLHSHSHLIKTFEYQILSAIQYLHNINIIHGNICPEAIRIVKLKNNTSIAKLTDFSCAQRPSGYNKRNTQPHIKFASPERRNSGLAIEAGDIWSFALTFAAIYCNDFFDQSTIPSMLHRYAPEYFISLVTSCLKEIPTLRPNAKTLLTTFYNDISTTNITTEAEFIPHKLTCDITIQNDYFINLQSQFVIKQHEITLQDTLEDYVHTWLLRNYPSDRRMVLLTQNAINSAPVASINTYQYTPTQLESEEINTFLQIVNTTFTSGFVPQPAINGTTRTYTQMDVPQRELSCFDKITSNDIYIATYSILDDNILRLSFSSNDIKFYESYMKLGLCPYLVPIFSINGPSSTQSSLPLQKCQSIITVRPGKPIKNTTIHELMLPTMVEHLALGLAKLEQLENIACSVDTASIFSPSPNTFWWQPTLKKTTDQDWKKENANTLFTLLNTWCNSDTTIVDNALESTNWQRLSKTNAENISCKEFCAIMQYDEIATLFFPTFMIQGKWFEFLVINENKITRIQPSWIKIYG